MGAVTADTERLKADTDDDGSERSSTSAAAEVVDEHQTNSCAAHARRPPSSKTARRSRLAAVAASAALFGLLLMTSSAFCVWTMTRLSRIEARLERLERAGRLPVNRMVEPPHIDDRFVQHLHVCTVYCHDLYMHLHVPRI